jgi:hypothetical protein
MSALARKLHSDELEQATLDAGPPARPALQIVENQPEPPRGLACRWKMDPDTGRPVAVWELNWVGN